MNKPDTTDKRVIVALDYPDAASARQLLDRLDPGLCRVKVGKEMFTRSGPDWVRELRERGFDVFLDLKFHDIPNTVAGAVRAAAELDVWMLTLHAGGGRAMLEAARDAVAGREHRPLLIAVTVLTSLGAEDLADTGFAEAPEALVRRLARLAADSGLDGAVCSARECADLRPLLPKDFLLVTPGIRPPGDTAGDQNRVETPASALAKGSSYLVIGRPITRAADPDARLRTILRELEGAR